MAGDHHRVDMPATPVPMHVVRNAAPERSCTSMKPGSLWAQAPCSIVPLIVHKKHFVPLLLLLEGSFSTSLY